MIYYVKNLAGAENLEILTQPQVSCGKNSSSFAQCLGLKSLCWFLISDGKTLRITLLRPDIDIYNTDIFIWAGFIVNGEKKVFFNNESSHPEVEICVVRQVTLSKSLLLSIDYKERWGWQGLGYKCLHCNCLKDNKMEHMVGVHSPILLRLKVGH